MTNLSHEESFLREIEADPLSAEPRLVYADWLDEHGDTRGSILRHLLKLGDCWPMEEDFRHHRARLRQLAHNVSREWLARIGYFDVAIATTDTELPNILSAHRFVTLRFWAPWSGPCQSMKPIIDELAADLSPWCVFLEANVDDQVGLAQDYNISAIPTVVVHRDREPWQQLVGFVSAEKLLDLFRDTPK